MVRETLKVNPLKMVIMATNARMVISMKMRVATLPERKNQTHRKDKEE